MLPKRLAPPGPSDEALARIVQAAGAAPDHDRLLPWRFVLVPEAARPRLAAAFEQALVERDPAATGEQRKQAREKAFRAPVLLLAVARLAGEPAGVPDAERLLSLGCAVQNMLLMATALGFASALTSGKALGSRPLRELFALAPHEQAVCFASIGTAAGHSPGQPGRRRIGTCPACPMSAPASAHPGARHAQGLPVSRIISIAPPGGLASPTFEQPYEMLEACHERVHRMLALLGRLREHVRQHGADDPARSAARDVMRYFDQAAPQHHLDEELHVFPRLDGTGDAGLAAMVRRLRDDHLRMESGWALARAVLAPLAAGELARSTRSRSARWTTSRASTASTSAPRSNWSIPPPRPPWTRRRSAPWARK